MIVWVFLFMLLLYYNVLFLYLTILTIYDGAGGGTL